VRQNSSVEAAFKLREERRKAEKGAVKTGWGITLL
jgi:hypothetical protein